MARTKRSGLQPKGPNPNALNRNALNPNALNRAYFLWTVAGTSLIVAAVAGSSIISVVAGRADAGTVVWGIIGMAALLEAMVLFTLGLVLRQRFLSQALSYDNRRDYLEDDGSNRVKVPLIGDVQARQNTTYEGF